MRSSYKTEDVIMLLKDLTGQIEPLPSEVREAKIQSGTPYSEMLPLEYKPTNEYMAVYRRSLEQFGKATALAVCSVAEKIYKEKGKYITLVSLARAGTPAGILIKRYLEHKYNAHITHYSISIIRGLGIDKNAMRYILTNHSSDTIQFVDGWTGKGAILSQLHKALIDFPTVSKDLAVIADPAGVTRLCGTRDDILIPCSCLNAVISGLTSRTIYRSDLISETDFHGAVYYEELESEDLSNSYVDYIESLFDYVTQPQPDIPPDNAGAEEVKTICNTLGIDDINLVKPGIGETTRVLLRRIPDKILASDKYTDNADLEHILRLTEEKGVPCEQFPLKNYKCCGIIKRLADA